MHRWISVDSHKEVRLLVTVPCCHWYRGEAAHCCPLLLLVSGRMATRVGGWTDYPVTGILLEVMWFQLITTNLAAVTHNHRQTSFSTTTTIKTTRGQSLLDSSCYGSFCF